MRFIKDKELPEKKVFNIMELSKLRVNPLERDRDTVDYRDRSFGNKRLRSLITRINKSNYDTEYPIVEKIDNDFYIIRSSEGEISITTKETVIDLFRSLTLRNRLEKQKTYGNRRN